MLSNNNWTWGFELEVGDVSRTIKIPPSLGGWEFAETDIINLLPPYQYVACDPLGISPPVGGEVNTHPTKTWVEQIDKINSLLDLFKKQGSTPTVCCTSHSHIHVRVPGLSNDIKALKKLTSYIGDNQQQIVSACYPFVDDPNMSQVKGGRLYFKYDGGRLMPGYMVDNIVQKAKTFEDFITLQCCGKDGVSRGRPLRYAINTYCLKHTDTIEFRCFRSTLCPVELSHCFKFVEAIMLAALDDGPSVGEILARHKYQFPQFRFSLEECLGWQKTKWGKERGKKQRKYIPVR